MAMNVSARTFTLFDRRVRVPLFDLKLAFISLRVRSSVKAGGMSPLSSSLLRAGAAGGGILEVVGA